jgi:hypothetical protein
MVAATGRRRFRVSIRTLMISVAVCAVLLVPIVWMFRQVEIARQAERRARAQAEQLRYFAEIRSAQAALSAAKLSNTVQPRTGNLWAGLSVNHPIFDAGQTKDLRIEFTLVNDGDKVIDPKIAESRLIINGQELTDPGLDVGSAQKDVRIQALSPGGSVQFGIRLGDHFKEPGNYRVSWKGVGFQSPEIEIRILPEKDP